MKDEKELFWINRLYAHIFHSGRFQVGFSPNSYVTSFYFIIYADTDWHLDEIYKVLSLLTFHP